MIKSNEDNSTNKLVISMLTEAGIEPDSYFMENAGEQTWIDALRGGSKSGNGGQGIPDFNFQVGRFHVLIEDKEDLNALEQLTVDGEVSLDVEDVKAYAVNGAIHYAKYVVEHSDIYNEIFAIGVVGSL